MLLLCYGTNTCTGTYTNLLHILKCMPTCTFDFDFRYDPLEKTIVEMVKVLSVQHRTHPLILLSDDSHAEHPTELQF